MERQCFFATSAKRYQGELLISGAFLAVHYNLLLENVFFHDTNGPEASGPLVALFCQEKIHFQAKGFLLIAIGTIKASFAVGNSSFQINRSAKSDFNNSI